MAALQEINNSSGIKLFGTTISLKEAEASSQPSDQTHDEDPQKNDQTVEKRPDKIIPCPRCKSMETKFCYFNNYNVNQPRHFCKGCQRYWTAGGALRNVPVGAGRRKNKPPGLSVFDASVVQQLDFDTVVEEWQVAEHGGFRQIFGAKRRRFSSNNGQSF